MVITKLTTDFPTVLKAERIMRTAFKYDIDKLNHSYRVVGLTAAQPELRIFNEYQQQALAMAFLHDVIEDTDFESKENCDIAEEVAYELDELDRICPDFMLGLNSLTKKEEEDYLDYIKKFNEKVIFDWGWVAKRVKIADMKDHLLQIETLTPKLKAKYLEAIPYLL